MTVMLAAVFLALVALIILACAFVRARIRLVEALSRESLQSELVKAKESELASQRESLRLEFARLAADYLGQKQNELTRANEGSLKSLFTPLREKLEKYEQEVGKSTRSNEKMESEFRAHVQSLQNFATEARSFTAALVGGNKIQGNQGENILAAILERSGLRKGVHYDTQTGGRDEGRPDVTLYDVRNHHAILIDSKMNIKDYIKAYNLPDDSAHAAERDRCLKAHVASIKQQVDSLSGKNYAMNVTPPEGYANLPLVAMFCPFDTVLEKAIEVDPALIQYAYERNIVFVTPLTMWGYLWLVSWGWKQYGVEQRYEEIKKLGGDVLKALDSLLDDVNKTDAALAKAQAGFADIKKRIQEESGQMSIRRVAEKLDGYGITAKGRLKAVKQQPPASIGENP